jgi:hypothetical protein
MEYGDFESIIKDPKTIIVLDTNIILDLARYSLYTSKNILKIFDQCIGSIWIPNQVYEEYTKNKYPVFGELKKRYSSFEKNLLEIINVSEKKIEKNLNGSYKYFAKDSLLRELSEKIEEFRDIIKSYKDRVGVEYDETTSDSPKIIEDIEHFINDLRKREQVGEKIGFKEKLEIIKEGELRYRHRIPPGFMDCEKDGIEKFGDLFVWKEILKLPSKNEVKNIIFITNDIKDDWWSKDKSGNLEMRSELRDEFNEINKKTYINFMTMSEFQKYASELYDLYEFEVYVDLNRNDELFIDRIDYVISNYIIEEIYNNPNDYLESGDIGSEGIYDVDISVCSPTGQELIYTKLIEDGVSIVYELEYEMEIYCISYEYWGEDEDTKEVIRSPKIEHTFKGCIIVSIERIIKKKDVEANTNYLKEDYVCDIEIIENNIEQISVNNELYIYNDEESGFFKE